MSELSDAAASVEDLNGEWYDRESPEWELGRLVLRAVEHVQRVDPNSTESAKLSFLESELMDARSDGYHSGWDAACKKLLSGFEADRTCQVRINGKWVDAVVRRVVQAVDVSTGETGNYANLRVVVGDGNIRKTPDDGYRLLNKTSPPREPR